MDRIEQREHLYGLSKAHVVREASPETRLAQEVQPAKALALVVAELGAKLAPR